MGCPLSRPVGRLRSRWGGLLLALASGGCLVPTPTPREVRDLGLETPQATFETFATAFRGGLLDVEYGCFSTAFRRRGGTRDGSLSVGQPLSQLLYRELRDELSRRHPKLRWALWKARVTAVEAQDGRHAVVRARVGVPLARDLELVFRMVREDYYELQADPPEEGGFPELLAEGWGTPEEFDLVRDGHLQLVAGKDGPEVWGLARPEGPLMERDLERVRHLRFGREWRIDDLSIGRVGGD